MPVVDRVILGQRFSRAPLTVDANNLSSRQRCDVKMINYNVNSSFILTFVVRYKMEINCINEAKP
jgi:hypothetical protein